MIPERLLQGVKGLPVRQSLHCPDVAAAALHGEQETRSHRFTVDQDGARPADPVLTAEMGARQAAVLANGIGERLPWLNLDLVGDPVDPEIDLRPVGTHQATA